jgi:hypothetical protein
MSRRKNSKGQGVPLTLVRASTVIEQSIISSTPIKIRKLQAALNILDMLAC